MSMETIFVISDAAAALAELCAGAKAAAAECIAKAKGESGKTA